MNITRATAFAILEWDAHIQALNLFMGLLGCIFSAYAYVDAYRAERMLYVARINGLRSALLRLHKVIHGGVFITQVFLSLTAFFSMTLPQIPVLMYVMDHNGPWVITVIILRKVLQLLASSALLWVSWRKVRWLHEQVNL